jgi:sulfofructose kinase
VNPGSLDVLCVGYSCLDVLLPFQGLPRYDRKHEVPELLVEGGGPAATAAVALLRLGCGVGLISTLGDDSWGRFALERLRDEGISTQAVAVQPGARTPLSVILADPDGGARTIFWNRGTLQPLSPGQVRRQWRQSRAVLVDEAYPEAATEAMDLAHRAGAVVVFDAGSTGSGLDRLVKEADFLVCSEEFLQDHTGNPDLWGALRGLQHLNGRPVIATVGAKGCWLDDGVRLQNFPAIPVVAIDSTGAGDAFHAAFVFAVCQGWAIERACRFSNFCASRACRQLGGRASLAGRSDVEAWTQGEEA